MCSKNLNGKYKSIMESWKITWGFQKEIPKIITDAKY
jgi:hypothetical protein